MRTNIAVKEHLVSCLAWTYVRRIERKKGIVRYLEILNAWNRGVCVCMCLLVGSMGAGRCSHLRITNHLLPTIAVNTYVMSDLPHSPHSPVYRTDIVTKKPN